MDLTDFQLFIEANEEILTYLGLLAGAAIGFVSGYVLRGSGSRQKTEPVQLVECVEMINTRVLDKDMLRPDAGAIQIRVVQREANAEPFEVTELYLARFRFRNLSENPVDKLFVSLENAPPAVWFSLSEGDGLHSPDWEQQKDRIQEAVKISEDMSWRMFPLPYLNPYSATKHDVILDIVSYQSLEAIKINGGARGIDFVFKKQENS